MHLPSSSLPLIPPSSSAIPGSARIPLGDVGTLRVTADVQMNESSFTARHLSPSSSSKPPKMDASLLLSAPRGHSSPLLGESKSPGRESGRGHRLGHTHSEAGMGSEDARVRLLTRQTGPQNRAPQTTSARLLSSQEPLAREGVPHLETTPLNSQPSTHSHSRQSSSSSSSSSINPAPRTRPLGSPLSGVKPTGSPLPTRNQPHHNTATPRTTRVTTGTTTSTTLTTNGTTTTKRGTTRSATWTSSGLLASRLLEERERDGGGGAGGGGGFEALEHRLKQALDSPTLQVPVYTHTYSTHTVYSQHTHTHTHTHTPLSLGAADRELIDYFWKNSSSTFGSSGGSWTRVGPSFTPWSSSNNNSTDTGSRKWAGPLGLPWKLHSQGPFQWGVEWNGDRGERGWISRLCMITVSVPF